MEIRGGVEMEGDGGDEKGMEGVGDGDGWRWERGRGWRWKGEG